MTPKLNRESQAYDREHSPGGTIVPATVFESWGPAALPTQRTTTGRLRGKSRKQQARVAISGTAVRDATQFKFHPLKLKQAVLPDRAAPFHGTAPSGL